MLMVVLLFVGRKARAADDLLNFDIPAQPVTQPDYFVSFVDQKRWDFEWSATGLADVTNRHVAMGGTTAGVGYYILDNLAITFDISGYEFSEGHSNGGAGGVTLGLRHHVLDIGPSSLYFTVSGGEMWASNNLPMHGSHLNNTFEGGIGLATPLAPDVYLMTEVKFFHLSNANNHGDDRNPSINAVQGVVGVMWRF
jgi:hypothetical protein